MRPQKVKLKLTTKNNKHNISSSWIETSTRGGAEQNHTIEPHHYSFSKQATELRKQRHSAKPNTTDRHQTNKSMHYLYRPISVFSIYFVLTHVHPERHSCAPGKNFPNGHPSLNFFRTSTFNFRVDGLSEKKVITYWYEYPSKPWAEM